MDNNSIRIFHSIYSVDGDSRFHSGRGDWYEGNCTFVCRRTSENSIDVAVSFCHKKDVFKKKEGIKLAKENLLSGNFVTLPIGKSVTGCDLNDVIRRFMERDSKKDFRHVTFGTVQNIPIKNWRIIHFFPR
jgi:hypothetical protein